MQAYYLYLSSFFTLSVCPSLCMLWVSQVTGLRLIKNIFQKFSTHNIRTPTPPPILVNFGHIYAIFNKCSDRKHWSGTFRPLGKLRQNDTEQNNQPTNRPTNRRTMRVHRKVTLPTQALVRTSVCASGWPRTLKTQFQVKKHRQYIKDCPCYSALVW